MKRKIPVRSKDTRRVVRASMRRRSGLMGFSVIEVGVLDSSILKTERAPRHPRSINLVTAP